MESETIGGKWTFVFFAVPNIIGILFTVFIMKETEGVPADQLKKLYASSSNKSML